MEDFFNSTPNWYRDFLYVSSSPEGSVQLGGVSSTISYTYFAILPTPWFGHRLSRFGRWLSVRTKSPNLVSDLFYYPFLMYIYRSPSAIQNKQSSHTWSSGSTGLFGCKTVRLNMNRKSGRKNTFLPDLSRVYGFVNRTDVCNLKPLYWNGIWTGSFELYIETTPRALFQKLYTVKLPIF